MLDDKCYQFILTFFKDTSLKKASSINGSFTNQIAIFFTKLLCLMTNWVNYYRDAVNLVIQDDFSDPDKVKIFDHILSKKESDLGLTTGDIFIVPTDLNDRMRLIRLVDASARKKIQTIDDHKKILALFGIYDVEFYYGLEFLEEYPQYNELQTLTLPLWGTNNYEMQNAWIIVLPSFVETDNALRPRIEAYFKLYKLPTSQIFFYYIL